MWTPTYIEFENFISHKNSRFEFAENKTFLIQGENRDDDGQESNGSGKSAIIEAITFALTGDSFRKVRAVDLIYNNEKESNVRLQLINNLTKQELVIYRSIKRKGGTEVKIMLNNEPAVQPSVNDYNKYILELLDITKEDLTNYFIISKDKYESFLLSTDSKKKNIIARFTSIDFFADIDNNINSDISENNKEINDIEKIITANNAKIEVYDIEELDDEEEIFENNKKQKLSNISAKIDEISQRIENNDKLINELIESQKIVQNELKNKKSTESFEKELEKIGEDENKINNLYYETQKTVQEYQETIMNLKSKLKTLITCPNCQFEFSNIDKDFNVHETKELLPILETTLSETKEKQQEYKSQQQYIANKKSEILKNISIVRKQNQQLENQLNIINNDIRTKNSIKDDLNRKISDLNEELNEVEKTKYVPVAKKDNTEIIAKLEKENEKHSKEIDKVKEQIQLNTNWLYNFKKFRTFLINKSIDSVEAYTNLFLNKIKTNLNIKLDGYKLLSDGKTIRENITVDILRDGKKEGVIDKFSNGEKIRIDICNILALQKLINLNSKSGGLNLLILDEIIESVDASGVNEILHQLNKLSQCIYVITHASNMHNFENKINVVKENKVSRIEKL